ncbi:MAG TPA: hypothetical protein VIL72_05105, partial [Beijerinckiaceae bacterium]
MDRTRFLILDTNVFLLFVVGQADERQLKSHRRLSIFMDGDYELLLALMARADELLLLPNIVTEASNLLGAARDPAGARILATLRRIVDRAREVYVESRAAMSRTEFRYLDLTDCALLLSDIAEVTIVSTDARFCHAARAIGLN